MQELFTGHPAIWLSCATLLGLLVGSFLNVVIHRLPIMLERDWQAQCADLRGEPVRDADAFNLVVPRSTCPHCGHGIAWYENIPLVSYLFLRAKCAHCRAGISLRYPVVEGLTGLMTLLTAWQFGFGWQSLAAFLLVWALLAMAFIDLDTHLLPDNITLPLLWLGLIVNLNDFFTTIDSAVLGAVGGYLVLWTVYQLFRLLTGKEGMGYGDFKLLAALGAWFGWAMLPLIIVVSSLVGAVFGVAMILVAGQDKSKPIPFGPYLAMAGLIALFWGDLLMNIYLGK